VATAFVARLRGKRHMSDGTALRWWCLDSGRRYSDGDHIGMAVAARDGRTVAAHRCLSQGRGRVLATCDGSYELRRRCPAHEGKGVRWPALCEVHHGVTPLLTQAGRRRRELAGYTRGYGDLLQLGLWHGDQRRPTQGNEERCETAGTIDGRGGTTVTYL
jgi:hypothetical protein